MPFLATRYILEAFRNYEYFGLMVYGPLRYGKSSYVIQLLAEVYGTPNEPDWDAWKRHMVFKPREFVQKTKETKKSQKILLAWDDAGFWLSHYGYHNPFIKSVAEYLNVAATDWASIIFTTPSPKWVITHVRNLPGGHTGRITKITGNPYGKQPRLRYIRVYRGWIAPDFKKSGVNVVFQDNFNVMLPNDVFKEYDQVRRSYTEEAKERMLETLHHIEKAWGSEVAERKHLEIEQLTGVKI